MVTRAPRFTAAEAARLAADAFGWRGQAVPLSSERDQNFLIDDGRRRAVLKIANADETRAMLEAENAVMTRLAGTGLTPRVVPAVTGEDIVRAADHFARLVTALDGRPMGDVARHSDALLADLGRAIGTIDGALAGFDHRALHREFYWDLAGAPARIRAQLPLVTDAALRSVIDVVLVRHDTIVAPLLPRLRRGVIHGDANDYNVLVDGAAQRVTGLVDFGDMVVSHVANDVAIAMAYAALGKTDPIGGAARVLRGAHEVFPLDAAEIEALFGLLCTRLALSICVAAAQQAARPDNAYLGISQLAIRETLPRLIAVHPRLAHYRFREACGLPPVPHAPRVVEWLRTRQPHAASVTGRPLTGPDVHGIDLSAGSPLVSSDPTDNAAGPLGRRIADVLHAAGAAVGAGGYDEPRLIYATDNYATGRVTDERRTVHIGIDLTLPPGHPVHAPIDGVVHAFEDAAARLDYGPVVVLRHEIPEPAATTFYTLYGHLDRESLRHLEPGKVITAGERFAAIGAPPENGDWWPHLHVQVITDLLDVPCNFNGVAPASQRATWLSLCPDPNLLLGIPADRFAAHRSQAALLASRRRHFGRNLSVSYGANPLTIVRGWMQYLFDETGRTYIDAYNNVPHVGHAHPAVTRAVSAQLATLNTNTRYLHETVVAYAERLTRCFPAALGVCFLTVSGSEANELALRLARAHTRRRDLLVMQGAYHGHTNTLIDISPYKHDGPGGEGAPDWVHAVDVPDVYRGRYRRDDPAAGLRYARDVGTTVGTILSRGRGLCGFIAETCPSVGGQILLPDGYLSEVYALVRAGGGVCIADEVQTGFGRLGTHFWAFEAHHVVPDIVVLGKPIANGYPMGAVVTTEAIAASFDNGMEFFSTFGGSTAACVAGLATLDATIDGRLQAHAHDVGHHLLARLRDLQTRHDLIGDVRGSGLFLGVELVTDRRTLEPAAGEAAAIVTRMRELGVLTGTDGPHHNVIKIRGPMPLTRSDADLVVAALDQALRER